jgi:hypothetical protein
MAMKNLTVVLMALVFTLMFSCKPGEDPPPPTVVKPTIEFKVSPGYVYENVPLPVSQQFNIGITATSASGEGLLFFKLIHIHNNILDTLIDKVFYNNMKYTLDTVLTTSSTPVPEKWLFEVTDKNEAISQIYVIINTYDPKPSLDFTISAGYIYKDTTLNSGQQFKVRLKAYANDFSGEKLKRLQITRSFNNIPLSVMDSTLEDLPCLIYEIHATAQTAAGHELWEYLITDNAGLIQQRSLLIKTN